MNSSSTSSGTDHERPLQIRHRSSGNSPTALPGPASNNRDGYPTHHDRIRGVRLVATDLSFPPEQDRRREERPRLY
jgi:hypothetical protein